MTFQSCKRNMYITTATAIEKPNSTHDAFGSSKFETTDFLSHWLYVLYKIETFSHRCTIFQVKHFQNRWVCVIVQNIAIPTDWIVNIHSADNSQHTYSYQYWSTCIHTWVSRTYSIVGLWRVYISNVRWSHVSW